MKITRILFAIVISITCATASAEIDVSVLTRGGWEDLSKQRCYFFNGDGTVLVSGYTTLTMKWEVQSDGSLKVTDGGLNTGYISDIKGNIMYWRDGTKSYFCPFAEKEDEIARRKGNRGGRDQTWMEPYSPNLLAAQLHGKAWMNDARDKSIYFGKPDTCFITDLRRQIVNDKYLWQALDSTSVKLTDVSAPHSSRNIKFKMHPDAFELIDNGAADHYIVNAYYDIECLDRVCDMTCISPVGCYDFFVRNAKSIDSFLHATYPGAEKAPEYAAFIAGRRWECSGISYTKGAYRRVSYVSYPDKNDTVQRSFDTMTAILNELYEPDQSQSNENMRSYIGSASGSVPLIITLAKTSDCVTLDVHTK